MKKEKGFTLIELLAVIVILAIILLIATPIILNIIDDVRKGGFKSSAHGYVASAEYKHLKTTLDGKTQEKIFTYVDGELQGDEDLDYGGESPKNGTIHITKDGKVALAIHNGKWCAMKNYDNSKITITNKELEECKLDNLPDIEVPEIIKEPNAPVLASGMKPIIYNETTEAWDEVSEDDSNWYDYDAKKWANVTTADGSMWVWIPRYAYQIATCYHTNCSGGAGTINIKFLQGKTTAASDGMIIEEIPSYDGNNQTNYIKHPAFIFGENEIIGFWVAKFEASGLSNALDFKPNVSSLRSVTIGDIFIHSMYMETNNRYGWGTGGNGVDTHLMKNDEWGAVAYLSQSVYGKNAEIWKNNSSTYITGCAGNSISEPSYAGCQNEYYTSNGQQASTTGNIYGIYDMSGGAAEYVSAYINNSDALTYGSNIVNGNVIYKNIYEVGSSDIRENNYTANANVFGDAVYETSPLGDGSISSSWYSDASATPFSSQPWFIRGGLYSHGASAGVFYFHSSFGSASGNISFRVTIMVGDGL